MSKRDGYKVAKRPDSSLKTYLTTARGYLFKSGSDYPDASPTWAAWFGPRATRVLKKSHMCIWHMWLLDHMWLFFYAFGQLFVAASSGFFKILLFETWLGDGLNKLSLEVTISCAVLMLTLVLIDWSVGRLPSGEDIVRRELESELNEAEAARLEAAAAPTN